MGNFRNPLVALLALFALAPAGVSRAEDVYAVRFHSFGEIDGGFRFIRWRDDIVFHNTTDRDLSVRLVGISNGDMPAQPTELQVPAGRTASAIANAAARTNWTPRTADIVPLWVVRLDVPPGVIVHGRTEAFSDFRGGVPPSFVPDLGAFSLPVFRRLTPPNATTVHLGADLGSELNPLLEANYTNVGVYNAGGAAAVATIQLRQSCDDRLVEERAVAIPANAIVQVNGLQGSQVTACPVLSPASNWAKYVTVRVDQPSLSYIVNKRIRLPNPPVISYGSSSSH